VLGRRRKGIGVQSDGAVEPVGAGKEEYWRERAQVEHEQTHGVLSAWEQLVDAVDDQAARDRMLSGLAGAAAKVGELDDARSAALRIQDPRTRGFALTPVVKELAHAGRVDDAAQLLDSVDDQQARVELKLELAAAIADTGAIAQARKLAASIEVGFLRSRALARVVAAAVAHGEVDLARKIADQIEDADPHDLAEKQAAGAMAEAGRLHEALQIAKRVTDPGVRDGTYLHIITAAALHSNLVLAEETVQLIGSSDPRQRAVEVLAIAQGVAVAGSRSGD
jgi:hypothetical protein